jgi:tRNA threonylcarbamoyladenosine biosynthesis protein TsaB
MIGGANPVVLGLDTATAATAVALRLADGSTAQARDDPRPGEHPGHATRLLELAHELLAQADMSWKEIDRIAVGVGPGGFTGLRVGIATAQGLAQSLSAEIVPVSSLHALAWAALAIDGAHVEATAAPDAEGLAQDSILAVIDARRGEVYAAAYERVPDRERSGADWSIELAAPRALAPEDLGSVVSAAQQRDGARARRWLAVGDGAVRFAAALKSAGIAVAPADSPLHLVSAAAICELGARGTPASDGGQVVPDYRRRPDAEIALEAAGAHGALRS